jgi:hypothetical protein
MNALIVGTRKQTVLDHLSDTFLLIDDGDLIDRVILPERKALTIFDVAEHSFNPLKDIDYRRAAEFVDILKAVYPEGESTLTKATFEYQLLRALREEPKTLGTLIKDTKDTQYAYQKIQRLVLSPVLEHVLNRPTNFSFKGTILARLDRARLGDFDCFVLANLLISQYAGQVVIPDFGFYAHKGHASLIRQHRLVAGVNTLADVPQLAQLLLTIDTKIASHATVADAQVLASYRGLTPGNGHYSQFIAASIA